MIRTAPIARVFGLLTLCLTLLVQSAAWSEDRAEDPAEDRAEEALDRLWQALDLSTSLAIMEEEGRALTEQVARDYLGGQGNMLWQRDIANIYAPETMDQMMRAGFVADLKGADITPMLAFFDTDTGQRIVALEMSARRAFLDPDTEDAARERVQSGGIPDDRMALIDRFIDVNDLVEFNTSGAMNTNVAFLSGLAKAPAFAMGENDILARVWEDAETSRADTEEWLRAYLSTAYQPLSDAEITAYIDFSRTEAGQRLNRALFVGYGEMYSHQYHALGLSVAHQMTGQDL